MFRPLISSVRHLSASGRTVCLSGSEAEGGVGVRACLHRSCTPRVGNLYSVKRTPDGPGARATEYKSLVAHKVWLDSDHCRSPFRPRQNSVPVWFRGRGGGSVLVFASTDPVPLGGHGETPWQVGASMFCFWLASSSPHSLSSALGSGFPAGWGSGSSRRGSGFRPAVGLGFVSGASGQHET